MNGGLHIGLCGLSLTLLASLGLPGQGTPTAPDGTALKFEQPKLLTASIYSRDHKQLLFHFKRVASRSGSSMNVERDFMYPDGKLAVRERVGYEGTALVSYEWEDMQTGARGSAKIRRTRNDPLKGSIEFHYAKNAEEQSKVRTEALRESTLCADSVGEFLAAHWEALARGEKLKCRYLVIPREETVGFTFARQAQTAPKALDTITVKMQASSPFVSALLDPLYFTVESDRPHRVLEYVGRTTPKINRSGKWADLDALTVFDWNNAR